MPKVVGIKFRRSSKVYYFSAGDYRYEMNGIVIAETARGVEYGRVAMLPTEISDDEVVSPLKPIMRIATYKDEQKIREFEDKHDDTMRAIAQKIEESKLEMKLVDIEYSFDGSKLVIYFTADNRVDFRELVKDLAAHFHTRIELRQIGARDECKLLGGIAPCGRACCCSDHTSEYAHVTIKMAKNQNLSLNPAKISGLCGRLMCCLAYENAHYVETNKKMPKLGSTVITADDRKGVVTAINQLKETVRVKYENGEKIEFVEVPLKDIKSKGKGSAHDEVKDEEVSSEIKKLTE